MMGARDTYLISRKRQRKKRVLDFDHLEGQPGVFDKRRHGTANDTVQTAFAPKVLNPTPTVGG